MLPPRLIRRLLLVPLVIVIAAGLVVLTPAVAVLTATFNLIRRWTGRGHRSRLLRVVFLALTWSIGEAAALTALLGLWVASGFGGRLDAEPYRTRHYEVMRWFLNLIYRVALRACGLRVEVESPPDAALAEDRPLIVLSRHAGPGDSLLLVHHLLTVCDRRPRVVMKATLQLDPSIDIVANRVPNAFLRRRTADSDGASVVGRSHSEQIRQVRRLAAGLGGRDALLLFPEGGNWTPQRWRRGIERLRRRGQAGLARRAAAMPNLLPPRTGGAFAAIGACPAADVIFVAHTGLDRLVSVRDVWHSLLDDMTVQARWWRVPAAEVPRSSDHQTQTDWLYDWWERLDEWISAQSRGSLASRRLELLHLLGQAAEGGHGRADRASVGRRQLIERAPGQLGPQVAPLADPGGTRLGHRQPDRSAVGLGPAAVEQARRRQLADHRADAVRRQAELLGRFGDADAGPPGGQPEQLRAGRGERPGRVGAADRAPRDPTDRADRREQRGRLGLGRVRVGRVASLIYVVHRANCRDLTAARQVPLHLHVSKSPG